MDSSRAGGRIVDEEFIELVLSAVEAIPAGRVASYGDIAELVGRGGPRQVGWVMSHHGAAVPWWRVVRADGRPADGHETRALRELLAEGVPLRGERVRMAEARMSEDQLGPWRDAAFAALA